MFWWCSVIRGWCLGSWRCWSHTHIGVTDSLHVEFLVVLHGLDVCCQHAFGQIKLFFYSSWASPFKKSLQLDWVMFFHHLLRESNVVAYFIAKLGTSSSSSLMGLDIPPEGLSPFIVGRFLGYNVPEAVIFCFYFLFLYQKELVDEIK